MTATIADVAARAGVSTATVSRVLSGTTVGRAATRERVLVAAKALDYRPSGVARSLRSRTTRTIGLLVTDILNPYYPALVRAVEDAARGRGLSVLLCNGDEDPEREAAYLELLAERRVDGILIAASRISAHHARWLARSSTPIVLMNSDAPGTAIPSVRSDNRAGGRLAAGHLLELGHRSLGYLAGPASNDAERERRAGIADALHANGATAVTLEVEAGDGHVRGGAAAAARVLAARPGITALACYNDLTAIGALQAVRAAGRRVPGDVSIVGFDDIDEAAWTDPPLTTIRQRTAEMGRWAVAELAHRLVKGLPIEPARETLLPVDLIVRGSTAPGGPAHPASRAGPPSEDQR